MKYSFLDYAEDSYNFLNSAYLMGIMSTSMIPQIHDTYEKYLKHIIRTYDMIRNPDEHYKVMSLHSVKLLYNYLFVETRNCFWDGFVFPISSITKNALLNIDELAKLTRFPSLNSKMLSLEEIEKKMEELRLFKREYDEILYSLEHPDLSLSDFEEETIKMVY